MPEPKNQNVGEVAERIGSVVIESKAFPGCYFLMLKSISAIPTGDYFCEQWEVGQILGGN